MANLGEVYNFLNVTNQWYIGISDIMGGGDLSLVMCCSNARPQIDNADQLTSEKYESGVEALLKSARALDTTNAGDCLAGRGLGFYVPETSG